MSSQNEIEVEALVTRLVKEGDAFLRAEFTVPVLVRNFEIGEAEDSMAFATQTAVGNLAAHGLRKPVAYRVHKASSKANAFAMGVTLGRVDGNDVVIHDQSISRFHAYLMEGKDGWRLVDAESRNGTFLNDRKLEASAAGKGPKGELVADGTRLRVGDVELRFMLPQSFVGYVLRRRSLR